MVETARARTADGVWALFIAFRGIPELKTFW